MVSLFEIIHGKNEKLIDNQVTVFLSWAKRSNTIGHNYERDLKLFVRYSQRSDILDITFEDIEKFIKYMKETNHGSLVPLQAEKAVRSVLKFYQARSKNSTSKFKVGRPKTKVRIAYQ